MGGSEIFGDHALFIIGNAHCSLKHDLKFHSFITELRIIRIKGITKLPTYTYLQNMNYYYTKFFSQNLNDHIFRIPQAPINRT